MRPYAMTLIAVVSIAAGQILFKLAAQKIAGRSLFEVAVRTDFLLPFGAALIIYAAATIFWVLALRDLDLSRAYMFMSLSFVIVPVIATLMLGEHLSKGYLIGLGLIIAGIIVTQING